MLDQIESIKELKTTKLSSCILQVLILALFLKDTSKSNKVIQRAVDMILNKDDLPKAVKRDLFNLVGRKILDLNNLDVVRDDTISNKSPSSQIVQSNLLSGGLSQHLYGYFTHESLQKMLDDSKFGNNPDLTKHLKNTLKNLDDGKFEAQLNEEDTKFLSIINPGKSKDMDFLIECL